VPDPPPAVTSFAFAGAGWVTAVHGLAVDALDHVHVVHVASRRGFSAGRRAEQTGAVACHYDDLPGGADVVLVATPPPVHRQEAERAVAGGAAALVETPLAATLEDADAIVALAAGGGTVAYGENLAYSPAVAEAVAACRRMGELTHLEVRMAQGRPDWAEHRLVPEWGGGALFDLGIHAVALALLAAAPARPVAVEARVSGGPGIEIDDDADLTLEFDTGLRAQVRASWRSAAPTWDAQAASATGAVRLELVPEPSVELNGMALHLPDAPPKAASAQLHYLGYIGQLATVAADVEADHPPRLPAVFGRLVLEIVCAAYTAARTGKPEHLPYQGPRDRTPHELWVGDPEPGPDADPHEAPTD
jgi:predicted dehydrogenase